MLLKGRILTHAGADFNMICTMILGHSWIDRQRMGTNHCEADQRIIELLIVSLIKGKLYKAGCDSSRVRSVLISILGTVRSIVGLSGRN